MGLAVSAVLTRRAGRPGGSRGIALTCCAAWWLWATAAAGTPLVDPTGDALAGTYQTYDITSIDAQFSASKLVFTIMLTSSPVAPSSNQQQGLSGFIDIDVDSNVGTGAAANIDSIGGSFGSTGLQIEYYLDLFTEFSNPGFVSLKDPINLTNTQVPITYGVSSFTITVPLTALGNDDGLVNYAVAVGDFAFAQDQALDPMVVQTGGLPASSVPVPEPRTSLLVAMGLGALVRRSGRRTASA